MIYFKKLSINNFMSIGSAEVDLATGGTTLISAINNRVEDSAGSNGSGKSSIAESIIWCLTGETIRGHKEVVNRYTDGNCSVKIEFEFKGQNWAVERSMSRSKEKSLEIYKGLSKLETKGYRDAQEVMQKELPELTYKFLNSVIVLGQGLPGRFTNNSPSGRKAVLEELTNADFMITQIKDNIKRRSDELSIKLRELEDLNLKFITKSSVLSSNLSSKELQLRDLEAIDIKNYTVIKDNLLNKVEDLSKQLEINELDLIKALDLKDKTKDLYAEKESLINKEVNKKETELVEKVSKIKQEYLKKISDSTLVIKERLLKGSQLIKKSEETIQHNQAKITGGICKTCGQKLVGITDEDIQKAKDLIREEESNLSKYRELYNQLEFSEKQTNDSLKKEEEALILSVREEVEKEIKAIKKSAEVELFRLSSGHLSAKDEANRLSARRGGISEELTKYKLELNGVISKIDGHTSKLAEVNKEIIEIKKELSTISGAIEAGSKQIEEVKSRISVVKQMETFASRDFRGILLEGIISKMNDIIGGYAEIVYGNRLTSFYLSGNSIQIEFDGKEYESLSGGEQQKINVILQLSLRDLIVELTGNTGSILFLDEVFDGLDSTGCDKVVELIQGLDTSTFIISHHSEHLNIPYDYNLVVIKGSDGIAEITRGV